MGGFPDEFRVGPGITVTRTKISRTTGVLDQATESHPLTGVHASVTEFGGQYSHRTFSRSAGGAVVGGLVGAPLLGAVVAPHKKVDNRSLQVTITGPGFCWTFSTGTTFTPHGKVAELNDRAAKYTSDPRGAEFDAARAQYVADRQATIRALAKVQRRLDSVAGRELTISQSEKVSTLRAAQTRLLDGMDIADRYTIDRVLADAAAARAAEDEPGAVAREVFAQQVRAELGRRSASRDHGGHMTLPVGWAPAADPAVGARRLAYVAEADARAATAASVPVPAAEPTAGRPSAPSYADMRDAADEKRITALVDKAIAARAAGKMAKAERLDATAAAMRANMAKRRG